MSLGIIAKAVTQIGGFLHKRGLVQTVFLGGVMFKKRYELTFFKAAVFTAAILVFLHKLTTLLDLTKLILELPCVLKTPFRLFLHFVHSKKTLCILGGRFSMKEKVMHIFEER